MRGFGLGLLCLIWYGLVQLLTPACPSTDLLTPLFPPHPNHPNDERKRRQQNPFYEMDMPIRCELFQLGVERLIERNTRELRKARSGVDM